MMTTNQHDANFLAGIEIGVRCAEKGMNLQAALEFGRRTIELYPQRNYRPDSETETGKAMGKLSHE